MAAVIGVAGLALEALIAADRYTLAIGSRDAGTLAESLERAPLATMTASRVINLYDLMDSAYDAPRTPGSWVYLRIRGPAVQQRSRGCSAGDRHATR